MPISESSRRVFEVLFPDDARTLAAAAGQRMRLLEPEERFEAWGFPTMTAWLTAEVAADDEAILLHAGTPTMAVARGTARFDPPPAAKSAAVWFRPEVFRAVAHDRAGDERYYIHRSSGHVVMEKISPGEDYIELPALDLRGEARRFLTQRDVLALMGEDLLSSPRWYELLPERLAELSPNREREWREHRMRFIVDELRRWAPENKVPFELLTTERPSPPSALPQSRARSDGPEARDRDLILAAIKRLPDRELLDLRLPVHAIFDALREQGVLK